jgi:hypothetical protein
MTLIQRLDEAMIHLNATYPIRCTCKTGETREGRPVYCGWDGRGPVCPEPAVVGKHASAVDDLFGRVA